jgi:hypothetical protein
MLLCMHVSRLAFRVNDIRNSRAIRDEQVEKKLDKYVDLLDNYSIVYSCKPCVSCLVFDPVLCPFNSTAVQSATN